MIGCRAELYIKDKKLIENVINNSDCVYFNLTSFDGEELESYFSKFYNYFVPYTTTRIIIHYCSGKTLTYFWYLVGCCN